MKIENFGAIIGAIAGIISFFSYVLYIYSIFKVESNNRSVSWVFNGETKPNRATWWILTLVGIMISASYYASGARNTIWVPIAYIIGPLIIAILSLKYGEGEWQKLDKWCLAGKRG